MLETVGEDSIHGVSEGKRALKMMRLLRLVKLLKLLRMSRLIIVMRHWLQAFEDYFKVGRTDGRSDGLLVGGPFCRSGGEPVGKPVGHLIVPRLGRSADLSVC